MPNAYIVEAVRTAGGKKGGRLRDWHPISLGAAVLDGAHLLSRLSHSDAYCFRDGHFERLRHVIPVARGCWAVLFCVAALIERSGADPNLIDDVIVGCVSQTGGQAGNIGRNMVRGSLAHAGE